MTVSYGPSSPYGPPGVVYASDIPCRAVPQTEIDQLQFPFSLSSYWITFDAFELHGPAYVVPLLGQVLTDYKTADVVEVSDVASGPGLIMRKEYVHPYGETPYWRCLVEPLSTVVSPPWPPPSPPVPPPPPPPGEGCVVAFPTFVDETVTGDTGLGETWYVISVPTDGNYHAPSLSSATELRLTLYEWPCDVGEQINQWAPSGAPCIGFPGLTAGLVLLKVWTYPPTDVPYAFVLEAGDCP